VSKSARLPLFLEEWIAKNCPENDAETSFFTFLGSELSKIEGFYMKRWLEYELYLKDIILLTNDKVKRAKKSTKMRIEFSMKELFRGIQLLFNYRV